MRISIITATNNSEASIETAISSVNNQLYEDIEHIFIDNLSSDNTLDIIRSKSQRHKLVISEKDNGIYDALNKGIKKASGDVIGFLHSDDFFAKENVVSKIISGFQSNKKIDIIYGDLEYVSKDKPERIIRKWKSGEYKKNKMKFGWMPPHTCLFMKRNLYQKYGLFDISYKISADYESILRYMWKNHPTVKYLPFVFTKMRLGGVSNRNLENIYIKMKEDRHAMKRHGIPSSTALIFKSLRKLNQFF